MTALRQKYIDELQLRGFSPKTIYVYVSIMARLARHYRKPPDQLGDEKLKSYLLHHIRDSKWSSSTVNVTVGAFRLFYHLVVGRSMDEVEAVLPRMKAGIKRPQVYSAEEIERMLAAPGLNQAQTVNRATSTHLVGAWSPLSAQSLDKPSWSRISETGDS